MDKDLFDALMESTRQAVQIKKGERKPSRTFTHEVPDVAAIRRRAKLSQADIPPTIRE